MTQQHIEDIKKDVAEIMSKVVLHNTSSVSLDELGNLIETKLEQAYKAGFKDGEDEVFSFYYKIKKALKSKQTEQEVKRTMLQTNNTSIEEQISDILFHHIAGGLKTGQGSYEWDDTETATKIKALIESESIKKWLEGQELGAKNERAKLIKTIESESRKRVEKYRACLIEAHENGLNTKEAIKLLDKEFLKETQ